MYSLVLIAALTPGSDPAPVGAGVPVVAGCYGCTGYASCFGCTGCTGCYGCSGSCHGGIFSGRKLFKHHKTSCFGCTGYSCGGYSCSGWSCGGYACFGSCFGCAGSCIGCTGCGGCGGVINGGSSWWGASSPGAVAPGVMAQGMYPPGPVMPSPVPVLGMGSRSPYYESGGYWGTPDRGTTYVSGVWQGTPFPGHLGGWGGYTVGATAWTPPVGLPSYSLYGQANPPAIYGAPHTIYTPVVMTPPGGDDKKPGDMKKPDETGKTPGAASLKFVVPAATKLYVDGRLTTLEGSERTFTTPPLAAGQKFYYDVKAEVTVNGKPVVEERRVIVEAGADLTESFDKLLAAAAAPGAVVAGK